MEPEMARARTGIRGKEWEGVGAGRRGNQPVLPASATSSIHCFRVSRRQNPQGYPQIRFKSGIQ